MVQVIGPGNPKKTFVQKLNIGLGQGLQMGSQLMGQQQQQKQQELSYQDMNSRYQQMTGRSLSRDPNIAKMEIEYALKGEESERQRQHDIEKLKLQEESKARKAAQEMQEKMAPFISGLETINQMRAIKNKGNLGFGSEYTGLFSPETRKDRATYSQLGKSLIALSSTIPIRNQQEFQTLAENLYNPSATEAELEGTLDAMENIIRRSMQQYQMSGEGFEQPPQQAPKEAPKERPPLSSFHR